MKIFKQLSVVLLIGSAFMSSAFAQQNIIKSINGVASYPANYQGTPHRAADEDPFISPTNAGLILIDYQPHILMGVKNIDHETLINNTTALIKSAVHFNLPIIYSHVGDVV